MTQYCSNCNAEVKDDYNFCLNCGTPVTHAAPAARTCPVCGAAAADDQLFCIECGTKFESHEPAAAQPEAQGAAPRTCPQCGALAQDDFLFCMECGARIDTAAAPASEPGAAPVDEAPAPSAGEPFTVDELSEHVAEEPDPSPAEEPAQVQEPAVEDASSDDATTVLSNPATLTLTRVRTGEAYTLNLPETLGKGSAATCRITGNSAISRRHVCIDSNFDAFGESYFLEELGATNKTAVNGVEVPRGQRRAIANGCRITLADEDFIFSVE